MEIIEKQVEKVKEVLMMNLLKQICSYGNYHAIN